jgi:hypothetical protein
LPDTVGDCPDKLALFIKENTFGRRRYILKIYYRDAADSFSVADDRAAFDKGEAMYRGD